MGNLSFGTYDEEEASKEKEELQKGGNEFAKLKVGRNVFRILPPAPGRRSPFRVVFQHFIEMPGGSKSVICARLESRKPCVVCAHVERLKKSQSHEDQKIADDLFARRRVFVNVIDRSDEEKGPKVLAVGKQVHEQLVALRDPEVGGDYCHPIDGFDVVIERSGTGKNDTKYKCFLSRRATPLDVQGDEGKMQEWIDSQADLDAYAKLPDVEEVKRLLSGEELDEDEAPARPARPATRPAAPATSARKPPATRPAAPARRTAEDDAIDVEGEPFD